MGYRTIGRKFANGPGIWRSIPCWVILKTQKIVFDAAKLNTQYYKVRIKGKVKQSKEWSSTPSAPRRSRLLKREPLDHPRLQSPTLLLLINKIMQRKISLRNKKIIDFLVSQWYIYIYIYVYVCVCVCALARKLTSKKMVSPSAELTIAFLQCKVSL